MNKFAWSRFFLCKVFICLFFLVTARLFSMPGTDTVPVQPDTSAQPDASAQPTGMPTQPDASAQPTGMPGPSADASAQMPAQPPAVPQPQAAPAADEVKPEQLGEFQLDENQPDIMKDKDKNIRNLVKKSNELSKQIAAIADKIKEMRDNVFDKFSGINSSLDDFYQKIGFESGRVRELLKEEK